MLTRACVRPTSKNAAKSQLVSQISLNGNNVFALSIEQLLPTKGESNI